jgi:hypothetical protein
VVFHTSAGLVRRWRRLLNSALIIVSLAASHEAVYMVRSSGASGLVPADGAHAYWPVFMLSALVALAAVGWWCRWRLTTGVRSSVEQGQPTDDTGAGLLRDWLALFIRLAPTVASAFLLLENAEHLLIHGHLEGLGVYLAPGAELSLPMILLVVAVIAALGVVVRWREVVLIGRLRAQRSTTFGRPHSVAAPAVGWNITAALVQLVLMLAHDDQGRAPPARSAA